jgi:flagellar motor switch protein FliM
MAKILTQDEIDALLSSVSGEAEVAPALKSKQKVSLYDFKHPNLVSKEQMRLLETIHEGLCRNFGVFLSAQLRMIVEMNLLAIDQIMYSEFVMSIAPPSCIYVCAVDEPYSQLVLELNPQLAIFIVERLFGGKGSFISNLRPISVIEQKIMRRVIDRIAVEISKNWSPVSKFNTEVKRFESNSEFVQIVPTSEPVVVVSMEIKLHGNSTLMNICYPYMWISSIVSTPEVQEKMLFGDRESSNEEKELVRFNLNHTKVQLRALLGKTRISVRDFINLKEGDVIPLNTKTDSLVPVLVRNRHLYSAAVGMRNKKVTCQVRGLVEGENEYEY